MLHKPQERDVRRQELRPHKVFHTKVGLDENPEFPRRDGTEFNIVTNIKAGNVRRSGTWEVMAQAP